jgi:hypothetical protein
MVPKKYKMLLPLLHGAKRIVCVRERETKEGASLLARDRESRVPK